jgi:hypothetical protein
MNTVLKKSLLLGFVLILALAMSACSSSDSNSPDKAESETKQTKKADLSKSVGTWAGKNETTGKDITVEIVDNENVKVNGTAYKLIQADETDPTKFLVTDDQDLAPFDIVIDSEAQITITDEEYTSTVLTKK